MAPPPTTRDRVAAHLRRYRTAAEGIVTGIEEHHGFLDDPADMAERAQAALAVAAQHEILQALTQLHLEADLFAHYASDQTGTTVGDGAVEAADDAAVDPARAGDGGDDRRALLESVERIREMVARTTAVARIYLDRAETNRLLIRLDVADVDLTGMVEDHLRAGHMLEVPYVRTVLSSAAILGDASKLVAVIDHLLGRLLRRRGSDQTVHVQVGGEGDEAEVFLGLTPWPDGAESLIGELSAPLRLEGIGIDVPYARAVVERHGGRFLVSRMGGEGAGYRLLFPRRETLPDEEVVR